MFSQIYQLSDVYLFLSLCFISITISVTAIFCIKYFYPIKLQERDNPVIGNISTVIGTIYGVLAGLMALYLINNIGYTGDAVQREANAVANLYRDSKWLAPPVRIAIQTQLKQYIKNVINVEWPFMAKGLKTNDEDKFTIEKISNELIGYRILDNTESLLLHDMLDELRSLYDAREQRIHMSESSLGVETWVVILIGTILTIGVNYFFKINSHLHIIAICAAALMASSIIFLLVTLERPFQGEFSIEPTALQSLLVFIEKNEGK